MTITQYAEAFSSSHVPFLKSLKFIAKHDNGWKYKLKFHD